MCVCLGGFVVCCVLCASRASRCCGLSRVCSVCFAVFALCAVLCAKLFGDVCLRVFVSLRLVPSLAPSRRGGLFFIESL